MMVTKTELHALRASGQPEEHSRHGGKIATCDSNKQTHQVYKYLGVYCYTSDQCELVYELIKSAVNACFDVLASLKLTASELIMLCNKQLQTTLVYRLLASPLNTHQLQMIQKTIWRKISVYGLLPKGLLRKNKYMGRTKGCRNLVLFLIFMQSQIFNFSMRYLQHEKPGQTNSSVCDAQQSSKANRLQNACVDSVYRLGGRSHCFRAWNLCQASGFVEGKRCTCSSTPDGVKGKSYAMMIRDAPASIDSLSTTLRSTFATTFIVSSCTYRSPPPSPASKHFLLSCTPLNLPKPLPPYPFPNSTQYLEANEWAHVYRLRFGIGFRKKNLFLPIILQKITDCFDYCPFK